METWDRIEPDDQGELFDLISDEQFLRAWRLIRKRSGLDPHGAKKLLDQLRRELGDTPMADAEEPTNRFASADERDRSSEFEPQIERLRVLLEGAYADSESHVENLRAYGLPNMPLSIRATIVVPSANTPTHYLDLARHHDPETALSKAEEFITRIPNMRRMVEEIKERKNNPQITPSEETISSIKIVSQKLDDSGHHDLADHMDKLAQGFSMTPKRRWMNTTGDERDAIDKDLKTLVSNPRNPMPSVEEIIELLDSKYKVEIEPDEAQRTLLDAKRRFRPPTNPNVEFVGDAVVNAGFTAEDIEEYTAGKISADEVAKLWGTYKSLHPEVTEKLVTRKDLPYANPEELLNEPIEPEEILKQNIGPGSEEEKIRVKSLDDLDRAAIDTMRLVQSPEFQNPDGSPNIKALANVMGCSDHRITRQLDRAQRIMEGKETLRERRPKDDRDSARDLAAELAGENADTDAILEMLNEAMMSQEEPWTHDNLKDLFKFHPKGANPVNIPRTNWHEWKNYIEQFQQPTEAEQYEYPQ